MAFWTCTQTASSTEHVHDYDEYMLVVEGCYTLIIRGERIPVKEGQEYLIPRGVVHSGEVLAGPEQSTRSAGTEPTAGNTPEFASSVKQEPVFKALFFSAFCTRF